MLESLTGRLSAVLSKIRGVIRLSEEDISSALEEVRAALLSADVNFRVAQEFTERVRAKCVDAEVIKKVSPGQMVIKSIHDELVTLLGEGSVEISQKKPLRLLLVGLHGSGKTTTAAKLGTFLRKNHYSPMLVACDVRRPAAIDQLETLARQEGFPSFAARTESDVSKIGKTALSAARERGSDALIFDTSGRLHIDSSLIAEIVELKQEVVPDEILLVADSALGQEAVNIASSFHEAMQLTGIVLTKLDGDTRGGAALSMKSVTGVPIKFIGNGEKVTDFEVFHPDRIASRILGMGDVVSLVEKAQETIDRDEADRLEETLRKADFTLEDFLAHLRQVKKMGPLASLMEMMPAMNNIKIGGEEEKKMKHTEALILSMTPKERHNPRILTGSRRLRVARGAGLQVRDLNLLIKQFALMRKMMRKMKGTKGLRMMKQLQGLGNPSRPGMGGSIRGMR